MSREAVLHALVDLTREHGYPPTYREIAERAGLESVASVSHHVNALEAEGAISRVHGRSRAIDVRAALADLVVRERRGTAHSYCENCWAEIHKKRAARFCSDACRSEAWKRNHEKGEA